MICFHLFDRTIAESKKKHEEKQLKAQQLRDKLREEKTFKLQKLLERVSKSSRVNWKHHKKSHASKAQHCSQWELLSPLCLIESLNIQAPRHFMDSWSQTVVRETTVQSQQPFMRFVFVFCTVKRRVNSQSGSATMHCTLSSVRSHKSLLGLSFPPFVQNSYRIQILW